MTLPLSVSASGPKRSHRVLKLSSVVPIMLSEIIIILFIGHTPDHSKPFPLVIVIQSVVNQWHSNSDPGSSFIPVAFLSRLFSALHLTSCTISEQYLLRASVVRNPDWPGSLIANRFADPRSSHPACWPPNPPPPLLVIHLPTPRGQAQYEFWGTHPSGRSDPRTHCHPLLFINILNLKLLPARRTL